MSKRDTNTKVDPTPRSRRWLGYLLLILAIFAALHWWQSKPLASGKAPPLAGDLVGGGTLDIGDLRDKPVLVHFWACWCPMCRLGDGAINAIAEDFDVVTVAIRSGSPPEISRHLSQESLSFRVISDPDGELARRWGVQGVPASFVLDQAGQVKFATVGYTTEIGLRARLWAAEMMD